MKPNVMYIDKSDLGNAEAIVPPTINTVPRATVTREPYLLQHTLETGPKTRFAYLGFCEVKVLLHNH